MDAHTRLIILYGPVSQKLHEKQQRQISGETTCMYRSMAEKFGEIIYLAKQDCKEPWEKDFSHFGYHLSRVADYINSQYGVVVWSVKHDKTGKKDNLLQCIQQYKVYYSCCSYNQTNKYCNISLVDTPGRVKGNAILWVKGKDPNFWKPKTTLKLVDYVFLGRRGDKNEVYFINRLTKEIRAERSILWIGGAKHQNKIKSTHHKVICTPVKQPEDIVNLMSTCRVGLILSEIPAEGFPQSFLEMTMMGLPVVYMGPVNNVYTNNCFKLEDKKKCVEAAEHVLTRPNGWQTRKYAIEHYTLDKSYESILKGLYA